MPSRQAYRRKHLKRYYDTAALCARIQQRIVFNSSGTRFEFIQQERDVFQCQMWAKFGTDNSEARSIVTFTEKHDGFYINVQLPRLDTTFERRRYLR